VMDAEILMDTSLSLRKERSDQPAVRPSRNPICL